MGVVCGRGHEGLGFYFHYFDKILTKTTINVLTYLYYFGNSTCGTFFVFKSSIIHLFVFEFFF